MTSRTPNTPLPTDSERREDIIDLENTFSHPAGLLAAQYLVRAIVQNAVVARRAAEDISQTQARRTDFATLLSSIPPHLTQQGALHQLLAFKRTEPALVSGSWSWDAAHNRQNIPPTQPSLSRVDNDMRSLSSADSERSTHLMGDACIHPFQQASASSTLSSPDLFPRLHYLESHLPQPSTKAHSQPCEDPHANAANALSVFARSSVMKGSLVDLTPSGSFTPTTPSQPSNEKVVLSRSLPSSCPARPQSSDANMASSLSLSSAQSRLQASDGDRASDDNRASSSGFSAAHSCSRSFDANQFASWQTSSLFQSSRISDQSRESLQVLPSFQYTRTADESRAPSPLSPSTQHMRTLEEARPRVQLPRMSEASKGVMVQGGAQSQFMSLTQLARSDESERLSDDSMISFPPVSSAQSLISDESRGVVDDRPYLEASSSALPLRRSDEDSGISALNRTLPLMFPIQQSGSSAEADRAFSLTPSLQPSRASVEDTSTIGDSHTIPMTSKKRKAKPGDKPATKKPRVNKPKAKRAAKPKPEKETSGAKLSQDLWMRILEYTPPRFLSKVRLVNRELKALVDQFDSIFVNCRKENFGQDMPSPPQGITERQYSNLLEGKGCQNKDCQDKLAARTHWSWSKRWCMGCWKLKIVREDRLFKNHAQTYSRTTLTKLFECIPVGMQDSFVKPHDYVEETTPHPRGAPRLYKVYLEEDVDRIFAEYEALTPEAYQEDPNHTAEEKAAGLAAHQALMDKLEDKRTEFFAEKKAKNDEHMAKVVKIEQGIRARREKIRDPHGENRDARKALFTKRAREDLPHIPEDFVTQTKAYKAATRIFRDPGSERGWQLLKPKIEKEWETEQGGNEGQAVANLDNSVQIDGIAEEEPSSNPQTRTVSPDSANYDLSSDRNQDFQASSFPGDMPQSVQRLHSMEHFAQHRPVYMSHPPHGGLQSSHNGPRAYHNVPHPPYNGLSGYTAQAHFPSSMLGSYSGQNAFYTNPATRQPISIAPGFGSHLSSSEMRRSDSDNVIGNRSNTCNAMHTRRPSSAGSIERFGMNNSASFWNGQTSQPQQQHHHQNQQQNLVHPSSINQPTSRVPVSFLLGPQTPNPTGQFNQYDDFFKSFQH